MFTDHRALVYLYHMQDTSNMLTRWAIALQNFDFTVKHQNDRELFASAVSVFPLIDPEALVKLQKEEFGEYFIFWSSSTDSTVAVPAGETPHSLSQFFLQEDALFRSYLPGYLRKRSSFRDQLVVPSGLRKLVLKECHDSPASGGHLAFKATFDKIRDRYWWPTLGTDVQTHCRQCVACQHRKTSHRPPKLPVGHRPITRPFQCVAIVLVEYKAYKQGFHYVLSCIDHLTRFLILVPLKDKSMTTVARALVDRVSAVFPPPETVHSDQGPEFENELVRELQSVFGFKKTRTLPYRPQGNSVLERVHSTMHNMLATLANASGDNWVELLPFVQLAHNTAYSKTLHETPHFLMFGRRATLPIDVILGVPNNSASQSRQDYSRRTVENLQFAYKIARRNLQERTEKQAKSNAKLTFPSFQPGDRVLVHRPYTEADGPNPKLISPWRGPFVVRSRLSPVIYRVSRGEQPNETSVHLARIKPYFAPSAGTVRESDTIDDLFLGIKIPLPDFENITSQVRIGNLIVDAIGKHKRAPGKPSLTNFQSLFMFRGHPPRQGAWCHGNTVPQCL